MIRIKIIFLFKKEVENINKVNISKFMECNSRYLNLIKFRDRGLLSNPLYFL